MRWGLQGACPTSPSRASGAGPSLSSLKEGQGKELLIAAALKIGGASLSCPSK